MNNLMHRNMCLILRSSASTSASSSDKSFIPEKRELIIANWFHSDAEEELAMSRSPNCPGSPLSVNKEYNNALRTKSFLDISKKAQQQLKKAGSTAVVPAASAVDELEKHGSSSFSLDYCTQLPEFLLDPAQETLLAATSKSTLNWKGYRRLRHLLLEYYDTTLEACTACTSLLASMDRTRTHHRTLRRLLIKFSTTRTDHSTIIDRLTAHLKKENPLSPTNLGQFNRTHSLYGSLIPRLAAARRRIRQRQKIIKASRYTGAALCGAAALVALVVAVHSVVGIAFVPAAAAFGTRWAKMKVGGRSSERAAAQVDAALKGAYIVGRDFDTLSRMLRRLHNEVEREREVGQMAVWNCRNPEVVKEVVKGIDNEEMGFEEQLEELEEHVYLCLVTINKSRRWVVEEMG